jgi:hypothetical protein
MPVHERKQQPEVKRVLTAEREPTIDIEIATEMPTSKGQLAEAANAAAPDHLRVALDQITPAPGRAATNARAAAKLATVQFDEGALARTADLLGQAAVYAAAQGVVDEIGDDEAALISAMPQQVAQIAANPMEAIEFRRVDDIDEGAEPVPPDPTTLPMIVQTLPAFIDHDIDWLTVAQTPGYPVNLIRALGRTTFRSFPCFAEHERKAREQGIRDPLSTIQLLAKFPGQPGPSTQRELDQMADWIRANGVIVDSGKLEYPPQALPGYSPEVVLLTTAEESFLLVRDSVEYGGSPIDGIYIYRWNGGVGPYLTGGRPNFTRLEGGRPADRQRAINAPARALAPPRPIEPLRGALQRGGQNQAPAMAVRFVNEAETRRRRRQVIEKLPTAESPTDAVQGAANVQRLRDAGFTPHAGKEGPGLRLRLDDGSAVQIFAAPSMRLIDSPVFRLRLLDQQETVISAKDDASIDDILAEAQRPASPKI